MSKETLYKHFGFCPEKIPLQAKIRKDIHKILTDMGFKAQSYDCVSISTDLEKGYHTLGYYSFSKDWWDCPRYDLPPMKIKIDYDFKKLEKFIQQKVKEIIESEVK